MFNLKLYHYAVKNFPEFSGYRSKVFPGQEPPRKLEIMPRRIDFENEWRHTGSKEGETIPIQDGETIHIKDGETIRISVTEYNTSYF